MCVSTHEEEYNISKEVWGTRTCLGVLKCAFNGCKLWTCLLCPWWCYNFYCAAKPCRGLYRQRLLLQRCFKLQMFTPGAAGASPPSLSPPSPSPPFPRCRNPVARIERHFFCMRSIRQRISLADAIPTRDSILDHWPPHWGIKHKENNRWFWHFLDIGYATPSARSAEFMTWPAVRWKRTGLWKIAPRSRISATRIRLT